MTPSRVLLPVRALILSVVITPLTFGLSSGQTMRVLMHLTEVDSPASAAGDVNGDGYPDLIAGRKLYWGGPGADGIPDRMLETTGDNIASSAGAGDVNGDGYADLILGHRDLVRVFWGGPDADGNADLILTAVNSGDQFGCSVSGAGDVNADGYDDVIVGASAASRAYVYWGGSEPDAVADQVYRREAGDDFGYAVSGAGDVNGDGYDDVIVGSPGRYQSPYSWAYVYWCGPGQDEWPEMNLHGEPPHPWAPGLDYFGWSVSGAGDVNGDGFDDVIVGAPAGNYPNLSGRAYVYWGGEFPDGGVDLLLRGESAWSSFGFSVSRAGDVNADGYDDLLVGTACVDFDRAYLLWGGPSADAIPDLNLNGCPVSAVGDLDGDGRAEFVVGTLVYSLFRIEGPPLFVTEAAFGETGRSDGTAALGRDGPLAHTPKTFADTGTLQLSATSPNPVGRSTTIRYDIAQPSMVDLRVYDVAGRLIRSIESASRHAGPYTVMWDGRDGAGLRVAGGTYFVRLTAGDVTQTRKVVFLGGQ